MQSDIAGERPRWAAEHMLKLLPKLGGPYFDFLVLPIGLCWEKAGVPFPDLRQEYYHHTQALRVQDAIVCVFFQAFKSSHPRFNYYGPTEYSGDDLSQLREALSRQIGLISSCRTRRQFQAKLPDLFSSYCNEDIGNWLPKWRRVRNELEIKAQQILHRIEQAERERKAFVALGV